MNILIDINSGKFLLLSKDRAFILFVLFKLLGKAVSQLADWFNLIINKNIQVVECYATKLS